MDSGAHTLYTLEVIWKKHSCGYDFYKSKEFVAYVDEYAKFLKKHGKGIDFYANVDVIFRPDLSWQVLKYLEDKHGLNPVPVIHFKTPMRWVDKHLDAGYKFLGIGGLGQEAPKEAYITWADRLFTKLCPASNKHLPLVRTHGFAMTAYDLILRYPWWSVDSASWAKAAGFGCIYVPHKRHGRFVFTEKPYSIGFSFRSKFTANDGKHFSNLAAGEKKIVLEWLEKIGVPLGSVDDNKDTKDYGVFSEYHARAVANLRFFDVMTKALPKYPWPFKVRAKAGLLPWEKVK
jgi:hypothetical protein